MNRKIIEYKMVTTIAGTKHLNELVNAAIAEGFQPHKKPIIKKNYFHQLMVKYESVESG